MSCSKSVFEDFHLIPVQQIIIFSCKKDNSLIGLKKCWAVQNSDWKIPIYTPNNFQRTLYIFFKTKDLLMLLKTMYIYKNKKSIVNTIIKSVETSYFCWKLIKSTTNEFCVPVVKFYFPADIVYPHHILGIIFSPRKWPIQESLYVSTNCTFCTIN